MDNRVEVPTWAPGEGSESPAEEQEAEVASAADPVSQPAASGSESPTAPEPVHDATPATEPEASQSTATTEVRPTAQTDGGNGAAEKNWRTPAAPAPAAPVPGPALANGSAQASAPTVPVSQVPAPPAPSPATAPLPSMPGASRRPKVSASFSGLSKSPSKAKPKPKSGQPKPGKAAGVRPRPQAWAAPAPAAGQQAWASPGQAPGQPTRRAQLRLDRIEPWSVMKFSFLISLIGWVILLVAVSVIYFVLSKLGVFSSIEHTVGLVTTSKSKPGSDASDWFKASRVLGYTMLVGAFNVFLITALATIGAVLYNLVTLLVGGIEVTLKESD